MDLVTELRKLEGINTSFDYGVEIVVMVVKETIGDWENLKTAVINRERSIQNIFKYDRVCGNGFNVAKKWLFDYIQLHEAYLRFIKTYKYCNDVYACISEELITLFVAGESEFIRNNSIGEILDDIKNGGFRCRFENNSNGDVEFRIIGFL